MYIRHVVVEITGFTLRDMGNVMCVRFIWTEIVFLRLSYIKKSSSLQKKALELHFAHLQEKTVVAQKEDIWWNLLRFSSKKWFIASLEHEYWVLWTALPIEEQD